MRAFGYRQSNSDHTLFLKKQHGKITTLIVYVDDMVVKGNDPEERKALQNYLSKEFEMKDLGPLKYFLGIEVSRSSEGIFLSQRKYVLDLLQETGMLGCQPVNTPIEEVSQYMHNPGEQHMNAVMRILRYLKNALGKGILFAKNVDHQSIEQSKIEESSLESISKSRIQGVWDPAHSTRMGIIAHSTRVGLHPAAATFHPNVHIWNSDAGWEKRAFQLPRSHISGSTYSTYPESFAAILHSVAMFS
ncbi:Retrovirus-related Pol polyprotein from transposon RE1 [Vitis vinifera]|uniref:Retrovirus-related Pol polyprotein from transposon RE1 n=1 Tax=Vitis vinifera TaxID=29760 RepID=A0A438CNJ7_VITVI|nr:Retrovirus-related Pol polyprotein from transposon RE1 [Vitis vinifera]